MKLNLRKLADLMTANHPDATREWIREELAENHGKQRADEIIQENTKKPGEGVQGTVG